MSTICENVDRMRIMLKHATEDPDQHVFAIKVPGVNPLQGLLWRIDVRRDTLGVMGWTTVFLSPLYHNGGRWFLMVTRYDEPSTGQDDLDDQAQWVNHAYQEVAEDVDFATEALVWGAAFREAGALLLEAKNKRRAILRGDRNTKRFGVRRPFMWLGWIVCAVVVALATWANIIIRY